MQVTKTVEFKAAMASYKDAFDSVHHSLKLSEKVSAIAYYHHTLDKLACRMMDDMGCTEFSRQRDREVSQGYSYYTVSFKKHDAVLFMLTKKLGLEGIPRFDTSANLSINVDMTPTDVVAEVRQMESDIDRRAERAKDALARLYNDSVEAKE